MSAGDGYAYPAGVRMLDNIVKGKIKRFYKDNTLVNQDYIKDSKLSVAAYVKTAGEATVVGYERVALV